LRITRKASLSRELVRLAHKAYLELNRMDELYDLKSDPYEMKNLVLQPGAAPAILNLKKTPAGRVAQSAEHLFRQKCRLVCSPLQRAFP
jgi:hypothetical protein